MSYRSRISVNPNINVQGLQSDILVNQHDLAQIQIDNDVFVSLWNNKTLLLFADNKAIPATTHLPANTINTLYLEPTQQMTFFGGVSNAAVNVFIDISYDGTNWFDSNTPVVKNSSNDFSINYHTQAPFIRLRFFNTSASAYVIEKSFASYKFRNVKAKDGSITVLDANTSFATIS
tara:strand:- start:42 stop:569 length:528 start_codon:yes stop_codon:yes gene_type:complete